MTRLDITRDRLHPKELVRTSTGVIGAATVIVASISRGGVTGRGEAHGVPYLGETADSVVAQIESVRSRIEVGAGRQELLAILPPGGARNALDCALWDWQSKVEAKPVHEIAGTARFTGATSLITLALDTPEAMAERARQWGAHDRFKLKLGAESGDVARVAAVRSAAPGALLSVDPNRGWSFEQLVRYAPALAELGVALIEEPVGEAERHRIEHFSSPVPLCADESVQCLADVLALPRGYSWVNIKLDKAGGLTEALSMARAADARGLAVVVGGICSTSLAVAAATVLAPLASLVDFDAPLFFGPDRAPCFDYDGGTIGAVPAGLWGWGPA